MTNFGPLLTPYLKTLILDDQGNVIGTASNPIRIDPTGTTAQPITGAGSGSNPAASLTGSPVSTFADYQGVNIGGNAVGVTGLALGATTKAPTVAIVDGSGNQITSFGGGTQYATGSAQATPTGTVALGWDGTTVKALPLDGSGLLKVVLASTTITGTVSVTQSGAWNVNQTLATPGYEAITDGTHGPAAVKAASTAAVAADPALVVAISPNNSVSVTGSVSITGTPSVNATDNLIQVAGVSLGSTAVVNYGSVPAAVAVPAVNAFITNTPAVTISSGAVSASQGTSPWVDNLTQVAGVPLGATAVTNYGTAPAAAAVIGVNAFITNTPTVTLASTTITGTVAVTQSVTPWLTKDAADMTGTTPNTAPGNTLIVGGIYNSSAPVPTPGQTLPFQLDTVGRLIVNVGSGSGTQYATGATPAPPTGTVAMGFTSAGVVTPIRTDPVGNQFVVSAQPLEVSLTDTNNNQIFSDDDGNLQVRLAAQNEELILNTNAENWGGLGVTPALTTSPQGTESAPAVRNLPAKYQRLISQTNPATSATVYYGPSGSNQPTRGAAGWYDTMQTGASTLSLTCFSSQMQNAGSNGVYLDTTDDPSNPNAVNSGVGVITAALLTGVAAPKLVSNLTQRYWQVRVINGTTPITAFTLTSTEWQAAVGVYLSSITGAQQLDGITFGTTFSNAGVGALAPYFNYQGITRGGLLGVLPYANVDGLSGSGNVLRTPAFFKTAQASVAGNTAVWTPTAAKKFRLMRYQLILTDNAVAQQNGIVTVSFYDATTAMNIAHDFYVPGMPSNGTQYAGPWVDLGNGYLSLAANNVLNANLSSALNSGNFRINVCGTEE